MNLTAKQQTTIFWTAIAAFAISLSFFKLTDPDIWWHIQIGKEILQNFGQPDWTQFYFTPIQEHITDIRYTWLGDVFFYLVHSLGGDVGLQLIRLPALCLTLFLLFKTVEAPINTRTLFFSLLLLAGLYQNLIVRNAIFTMVFIAALFYLWHAARFQNKPKLLWAIPVLLGVWSCMHGGYLLGFGLLVLLLGGDLLDWLQGVHDESFPPVLRYYAVGALSLLAIGIFNAHTMGMIRYLLTTTSGLLVFLTGLVMLIGIHLTHKLNLLVEERRPLIFRGAMALFAIAVLAVSVLHLKPWLTEPIDSQQLNMLADGPTEPPDPMVRIKLALNNTLWKMKDAEIVSGDFASPFDHPGDLHVWSSFLLALFALIGFLFARPFRLTLFFPFLAILVLAMGYNRITGYLALVSMFTLLVQGPSWEKRFEAQGRIGQVITALMLLLAMTGVWLGKPALGLFNNHYPGLGREPSFSEPVADVLLEKHRDNPIFNTISNGGFLLNHWNLEKSVFLDGFFQPHRGQTFSDYTKALTSNDPDLFYREHGAELSVVLLREPRWVTLFSRSENWYPLYMDTGMIAYQYQPKFDDAIAPVEVFFDSDKVAELPAKYRSLAANRLFEMGASLMLKGRLSEANSFHLQNETLLSALEGLASPETVSEYANNRAIAEKSYQHRNTPAMRNQFLFDQALRSGKQQQALDAALAIIELTPQRIDLLLKAADLAINVRDVPRASALLQIHNNDQSRAHPEYDATKPAASLLWRRLAQLYMQTESGPGYTQLKMASRLDPATYSQATAYREALQRYIDLDKAGRAESAYAMLQDLIVDDPNDGQVRQYLAFHLFRYGSEDQLKEAEQHALRAIEIFESKEAKTLDSPFYILSNIYRKMGQPDKAEEWRQKALDAAPIDRKHLYEAQK